MAYNKNIINQVSFIYTFNELFDEVSMRSTYATKSAADKEGNSLSEELSVSEDERDIFMGQLANVLSELFEVLHRHLGSELLGFTQTSNVSFTIKDNAGYVASNLVLVDTSFKETLIEGCLMEWYKGIGQVELFRVSGERYASYLETLKQRLFLLKKKRAI